MPAPTTTWTMLAAPASDSTSTVPIVATVVRDTFSDTSGVGLLEHVGEVGATWSRHPTVSASSVRISGEGSTYPVASSWFMASGTPTSADYDIAATLTQRTRLPLTAADLVARSSSTNVDTRYGARYATTDNRWEMYLVLAGVGSVLTNVTESLVTGQVYNMRFVLRGTALALYVDNVLRLSSVGTHLTLPGRVGIAQVAIGANSNNSGLQFGDFVVTEDSQSVVTSSTPVPAWSARTPSSTTWAKATGASTTWTTL